MKSDIQLKADVTSELAWDPAVNATKVGVAVRDGVVTLSGTLDSFMEKYAVERAARRVTGVRGIAVDLEVRVAPSHKRNDQDIAQAAASALRWHSLVPDDRITVEVEDAWVTLRGELDWAYQKSSAEQCVRPLTGVRGVTNAITLKPQVEARDIAREIGAALVRHANREAAGIKVIVDAGVVTLKGTVDSMAEHDAALVTASATRGVVRVVDELLIAA
ncbi:BON domain-containing protein [Caenimonas aquaedulcis]|uniref:BON domain-containing protein n=1 Tax=Caenimonas aquaedulcis TaxID=2793270 RepID=A0A931H8A2_9BURK|nr:BON domain-containing protein [Caenimonas aquaedulcis]MBG9390232.1 BON domain-containing protein [Caenimonas aquaedulcis]